MMQTALPTSRTQKMPSIALNKAELKELLDALMQMRCLMEDRAPLYAERSLDGIWRTQVRLLSDGGRLPRIERSRLLNTLRESAGSAGERVQILFDRIEAILS